MSDSSIGGSSTRQNSNRRVVAPALIPARTTPRIKPGARAGVGRAPTCRRNDYFAGTPAAPFWHPELTCVRGRVGNPGLRRLFTLTGCWAPRWRLSWVVGIDRAVKSEWPACKRRHQPFQTGVASEEAARKMRRASLRRYRTGGPASGMRSASLMSQLVNNGWRFTTAAPVPLPRPHRLVPNRGDAPADSAAPAASACHARAYRLAASDLRSGLFQGSTIRTARRLRRAPTARALKPKTIGTACPRSATRAAGGRPDLILQRGASAPVQAKKFRRCPGWARRGKFAVGSGRR